MAIAIALMTGCGDTTPAPSGPAAILSAYRTASGGDAWGRKAAIRVTESQRTAGLNVSVVSTIDLRSGDWVAMEATSVAHSAGGFDGTHVWSQDADGVTTIQAGLAKPLAVNAAYLSANRWWQSGFGNAKVASDGKTPCGHSTCNVLTVTPKGGLAFRAWFSDASHLLVRTSFHANGRTVTDDRSDYRRVDGVQIPFRRVITSSTTPHVSSTHVVTAVAFLPRQPPSSLVPPKTRLRNVTLASGATRTTFPFRLILDNIFANVRVNGHGPLRFLLDTGGGDVVRPSAARELGVDVQQTNAHGAQPDHGVATGIATLRSIDVGGAKFTNLPVAVMDAFPLRSPHSSELRIAGMIGPDMLNPFVVRIDYRSHQVTLIEPGAFNPHDAGVPIPFESIDSKPVVKAALDGIPGDFVIDTGMAGALMLTPTFANEHHFQKANPDRVTTFVGTGEAGGILAYVTRMRLLSLRPFQLRNIATEMSQMKQGPQATSLVQGMIGNSVLRHFVVTLDYANYTAYFKLAERLPPRVGRFDRSGLACLARVKTGFKIWCVTPHSPARQAGMELGQIITAVDGKRATAFPLYALMERMRRDPPGTVVHITATQGTITHHFAIKLRDQI